MDDKIVLDRKSFEALAVDTRVRILKSLKERRKTLSEIAKEQKMSVSGIKEHLATLEKVGLIEKFDDGHKWKYYELTKKGKEIVGPKELRVWILLSISTFALIASVFTLFSAPMAVTQTAGEQAVMEYTPPAADRNELTYTTSTDAQGEPEAAKAAGAEGEIEEAALQEDVRQATGWAEPDLRIPLAVASISALVMLGCLGILARNRLKTSS